MKILQQFLTLLPLVTLVTSQILAIDFGTQFVKAAVVNKGSGKAFSIVETPRSQRKFINSIGFYSQERFYEYQSIPKRTRYPKNCFIFNKLLVDSVLQPQLITTIRKDLLLQYITSDLKDPLLAEFTLQNFPKQTEKVTLIEVVGMLIKYAKGNAQKQIKQTIKDVVLTVPSYWNIKMRAFIIEAAQIADLHVLSLISQNTAAAINYALNQRNKNTSQTILFYNLGSNSLQMSLVQFKGIAEQKVAKPVQSIFVLGDYSKNYVGGLKFDSLLFNYFKKRFQTKHKKQLTTRGAVKLWGEVSEVKQVLSANKDSTLYVQGIMEGIDYHDKVTRVQFEKMIEDDLKEITTPIKRFLFDHNLKVEDIDNVQLIGGSSRIPILQTLIGQILGNQTKVGTHINADEAMVLGAAFYGANSSKKFKVKGMNLYDGFNFQIRAVIKNLQQGIDESDERYFFKNVTVFHKKNRFGLSKQLNFKSKQNVLLQLYKQDENGLQLLRSDKLTDIKDVNQTDFKVSITLVIDPIQVVQLKKAEIKYKKDQVTTYMQKVKKQKTNKTQKKQSKQSKQSKQDKQPVEQQKQIVQKDQQQHDQQNSGAKLVQQQKTQQQQQTEQQLLKKVQQQIKAKKDSNKTSQKKKKSKQPKQQYQTVQRSKIVTKKYQKDLNVVQIYSRQKADHDNLQKSRKMLKQYQKAQDEKKKLSQAKNTVQSLINQIRQKLDNQQFLQYVQKSQKQNLQKLVQQKSQWYDDTTSTNKHDYDQQSKLLSRPLQKIKKRIHQYQSRQVHYKKSLHSIEQYRQLSVNITKKKQWIRQQQVKSLLQKIQNWKQQINEMYQKMQDTPQNQTCIFQIKDIQKIVQKVKDQYFKVMSTPKPKKQKKQQSKKQKEQGSADQEQEL